jgi:hypothetical protein
MNPNYSLIMREDFDKLLDVGFTYPMVFTIGYCTEKKELKICVDYQKLNAQTKKDPFPLRFLDLVLDIVARHDMYSFMDDYSGYNKIKMAKEYKDIIAFMYQNGEHMLIMLCHLAYVMPQLPFKRLLPRLLTNT